MSAIAIILAAGLGTRMRSAMPKALHPIAGRPMLNHLIAACETVFDRIVVVVGPGMEALERAAAPHPTVVQSERLGTGHAALQAAPLLEGSAGDAAVLYADNPLVSEATLRRLLARRTEAGLALLAMRPADPGATAGWCENRRATCSAWWSGRTPTRRSAASAFATRAWSAPPPPIWSAGSRRCATTTRRASTT